MPRPLAAAVLGAAAVALSCGGDAGDGLTVLAAASLTEAFGEVGRAYTEETGVEVTFSFGASSAIADQVAEGFGADVVATASQPTMQALVDAGHVGRPVPFAANRLEIAVPPGNPAGVRSLADLADPSLTLAVCAPAVPCGALAAEAFAAQGVEPAADTEEEDVKGVLDKVATGEADAGVVYRTDVVAAGGEVDGVAIPDDENVVTTYPMAVVEGADPAADDFVEFVVAGEGQAIVRDHGFAAP